MYKDKASGFSINLSNFSFADSPSWSRTFFTEQTIPLDFFCGTKLSNASSKSSGLLIGGFTSSAVEFPRAGKVFRKDSVTSPASWNFVTARSLSVNVSLRFLRVQLYTPT